MNTKGFSLIPIVVLVGIVLVIGGLFLFKQNSKLSSGNTPLTTLDPNFVSSASPEPTIEPSATPKLGSSNPTSKPTTGASVSTCNTSRDVCFNMNNPNISIQEGYLSDANYWISDQLTLTGKGSGGYTVSISGFPSQFSVRVQDQNFPDNGSEKIFLRAQKDVAKKGTYQGTISVKSFISGVTTTANLTINYVDWDTSAIHTDPAQVNVDCTVKNNPNYTNSRQLDCGSYESMYLIFYYYKNNKTIEVRTNVENSATHSLAIDTDYTHQTTFTNQDNTRFHYFAKGFSDNLNEEQSTTYKGSFSFIDQSTQKEILRVPYTLTVHAY